MYLLRMDIWIDDDGTRLMGHKDEAKDEQQNRVVRKTKQKTKGKDEKRDAEERWAI